MPAERSEHALDSRRSHDAYIGLWHTAGESRLSLGSPSVPRLPRKHSPAQSMLLPSIAVSPTVFIHSFQVLRRSGRPSGGKDDAVAF